MQFKDISYLQLWWAILYCGAETFRLFVGERIMFNVSVKLNFKFIEIEGNFVKNISYLELWWLFLSRSGIV